MRQDDPTGPDLAGVIATATEAGLKHVVIGGFSVIYHGYIRATMDTDLLVPDGEEADEAILKFLELSGASRLSDGKVLTAEDLADLEHVRVTTRHGIVDIVRGGVPPLDFESVAARAEETEWQGVRASFADLSSLVGFKRLAGRSQDRLDLENLERLYGELPIDPIPGLDD